MPLHISVHFSCKSHIFFGNKQCVDFSWKQEILKNKYSKNIVLTKLIVEGMKAQLYVLHIIMDNTWCKKIFIKPRGQSINTDNPLHAAKVSSHHNTHFSWLDCIRNSQLIEIQEKPLWIIHIIKTQN